MKRFLLSFSMLCVALMMHAQFQVQGIPRDAKSPAFAAAAAQIAADYDTPPSGDSAADGSFTFDMIQNWSGEGENRAALVLQFNDSREEYALVFGYRFDGESTGIAMIETIVKNNPRLYWLTQSGTAYGSVFAAMGWDEDNDGDISLVKGGVTYAPTNEWGIFYTSGYDYDSWTSGDEDDFWASGWNSSYWSYWVKASGTAKFSYSNVGISGRKITDGCWDGWNFAKGMQAKAWKTFKAAPSLYMPVFKKDGIYYKLTNEKKGLVSVIAPTEIEGETLTSYSGSIAIPATVEYGGTTCTVNVIDKEAFKNSDATSISLPASIEKVGDEAFKNSAFTAIALPNSVTEIGANAFESCSAGSITIPTALKKVGKEAFKNTQLESIVLPSSVTSIGSGLFQGSSKLTYAPLPESITAMPANTYDGTAITTANIEGYTEIGENAFRNTKITSVSIPGSVLTIGDNAFNTGTLTSVTTLRLSPLAISDNVFSDATYASGILTVADGYADTYKTANGWSKFQSVQTEFIETAVGDKFPYNGASFIITKNATNTENGEVKITYYSVDTYSATNVRNANKAGYVGDVAIAPVVTFQGKNFDVVAVTDSAFIGATALTSVSLPATVNGLGKHMADGCTALTTLDLSSTKSGTVPEFAFYNCSKLLAITFPQDVVTIERDAFYGCKAAGDFEIPASVTKIDNYAFDICTGITTITVPASVTTVGTYVFAGCTKMTSAIVEGAMGESMFRGNTALTTLTLPEGTTTLRNAMLYGCTALTSINVWDELTTIEGSALYNCRSLKKTLPAKLESAGSSAFYGCTGLTGTIPATLKSIEASSFRGCTGLTGELRIPEGIASIGNYAFYGCTGLTTVVLPSSLTAINTYAFYGCTSLSSITWPETLTTLGTYSFYNCKALTGQIVVPEGVKAMSSSAFYGCTGLTSIVLPTTTTSVASNFISGCTNLKKVYIPLNSVLSFSSTYLRTSTSSYPTLAVPYTQAAGYKSKYTSYTVEAIAPEAVATTGTATTDANSQTAVSLHIDDYTYADDVPAAMQALVSDVIAPDAVAVEYRKAGSADEFVAVEATLADGTVKATLAGLEANTSYEVRAVIKAGSDLTISSNAFTFNTPAFAAANGVFVLNEGWFGHENGHLSYYDGSNWTHKVVESVNGEDIQLGATAQFATIYGGKLYVASKQDQDPGSDVAGARLTVFDAATLEVLHQKATLENEGDTRAILATPDYLYVGTTSGILVYDINSLNYLYTVASGEGSGLYDNQIGTMLHVGDRVFAVHQKQGILVLNAASNELETTIADANGYGFGSIVMSRDGNIWASVCDPASFSGSAVGYMLRIDPYTLATEQIDIQHSIPNSWYAWNADGFFASNKDNKLYWKADAGWGEAQAIYSYDIDTKTESTFIDLDGDDYYFYSAAARVNPATGEIHAAMNETGYGKDVMYRVFDESGNVDSEYDWNSTNYPFPALVVFPDTYAPSITLASTIVAGDKTAFDYTEIFSDADNFVKAAVLSATTVSDGVSVEFAGGKMLVSASMEGSFTLTVNSNGKLATATIGVKPAKSVRLIDADSEEETATGNELAFQGDGFTVEDISTAVAAATEAVITLADLSAATLADGTTLADVKTALSGSNVSANVIVIAPAGTTLPDGLSNVVADGKAHSLVLTDKADLTLPATVNAAAVSYAKTGLDGAGWYSAVLPYEFNIPAGVTVLSNASVEGNVITFSELTGTVAANTPFIYKTADGEIAFEAENVAVAVADSPESGALLGIYTKIGAGKATGKLIINSAGDAFAVATETASIPAFRAYLNAPATGSNTYAIVINDDLTGLATIGADGTLGTEPVDVYATDGRLLLKGADPLTALQGLAKGIYIINGKKIRK